jgi:hypothetical protein
MHTFHRKSVLLAGICNEHAQLDELLDTLSEEQMLRPGITGPWSIKDVLVHLTWWEQDLIQTITQGKPLNPDVKKDLLAVDHANALAVEAQRQTPVKEVQAAFLRSSQQLLETIEHLSEEELANEETYTYLLENTSGHYAEHRLWIADGLASKPASYASTLRGLD